MWETIEGIEALAMIDPGQGPELVQIGIGYGAVHVENMTILREIVPTLERKEVWTNSAYVKYGRARSQKPFHTQLR